MEIRQLAFFVAALAAAGCATVPTDAALEVEDLCEFSREKVPGRGFPASRGQARTDTIA